MYIPMQHHRYQCFICGLDFYAKIGMVSEPATCNDAVACTNIFIKIVSALRTNENVDCGEIPELYAWIYSQRLDISRCMYLFTYLCRRSIFEIAEL